MALLVPKANGHLQNQLTKSLEKVLEEANQSGELKLSNRKLKDFPKTSEKFNLTDTVIADLSKNRFSELPEEVTAFFFLEKLHCYHNSIRCIPDSVGALQCLRFLDLSRNQLTALPRELCQLPIQILLVSNNNLTCLPDELCRMSQLTELDVSSNQLTHLPPRMSELKCLQSLVLRNNLLLAIPIEITFLKLTRLDLRANRISILPIELRDMTVLIDLFVEDNPLTSPPASLCRRGKVHIFKYLESKAITLDRKAGISGGGTLGRRTRKGGTNSPSSVLSSSSGGLPLLTERLKQKRQNVDSGYSTSSDICDKRWSQEILVDKTNNWSSISSTPTHEINGTNSTLSTVSLASDHGLDDDYMNDGTRDYNNGIHPSTDPHNFSNGNNTTIVMDDKSKQPIHQIQTYREYKEALKQQRAHDVPSIYRIKDTDDQSYNNKTEPNTPTHHYSSPTRTLLATSKSDPTPLNSLLSSSSAASTAKHILFDEDTNPNIIMSPKRTSLMQQQQHHINSFLINGNNGIDLNNKIYSSSSPPPQSSRYIQDYVKPMSPIKADLLAVQQQTCTNNNNNHSNGGAIVTQTNNMKLQTSLRLSPVVGMMNVNGGGCLTTANNTTKSLNGVRMNNHRTISWNKDVPSTTTTDKMTFTMRREIDKAREETDLINQLRNIIESRLKMILPENLAPSLTDGVVLCHLANHIKPRSVASIHVPSPAVPKLTMARCRRNVDNFIEACRKIGVDENLLCCSADVLEGRGLVQIAVTVTELLRFHLPRSPMHNTTNSTTSTVV